MMIKVPTRAQDTGCSTLEVMSWSKSEQFPKQS